MINLEKGTYAEKDFCYAPPILELLNLEGSGVLCTSGGNEDFIDNTDPVDWFVEE